jgi:hypothetical protein
MSQRWNVTQIHALSRASVNAGHRFHTGRTLARLEKGEITVEQGTELIGRGRIGRTLERGTATPSDRRCRTL